MIGRRYNEHVTKYLFLFFSGLKTFYVYFFLIFWYKNDTREKNKLDDMQQESHTRMKPGELWSHITCEHATETYHCNNNIYLYDAFHA